VFITNNERVGTINSSRLVNPIFKGNPLIIPSDAPGGFEEIEEVLLFFMVLMNHSDFAPAAAARRRRPYGLLLMLSIAYC
jgi:hypothetical protein